MSEFAAWIPERAQRAQAAEDARERAEARRAEAERAEAAEDARERALGAYKAQAELRGEVVSALALATGEVGRSLDDILTAARGDLARDYAPQRPVDERFWTEPVIHASRSAWPESEYAVDRQLRRADELHRDFVAVRARYSYPAAEEAARSKSDAVRSSRRVPMIDRPGGYGEVTRVADADGMGQLGTWSGGLAAW
jgi:hypothetical protein